MFKKQEEKMELKEVETIIGPSVKVKGDFHGQGNIIVEGIVEGSIKTANNLFIGDKAKVMADIESREARIGGEISGNIKTKGYLEISSSARITGDIEAASLSIARGAVLNGKCTMGVKEKEIMDKK